MRIPLRHFCRVPLLSLFTCLFLSPGVHAQGTTAVSYELKQETYSVAPTRNGEMELVVDLYTPREGPIKGAVVLMHGGGFTDGYRELQENKAYGEALAGRGYLAAAISYRLHKDAPVVEGWAENYSRMVSQLTDPRLIGAVKQFGPEFTDAVAAAGVDLVAAVDWLRKNAAGLDFDPENIALFGASAGSITALTTTYAMEYYGAEDIDVACVIDLRGFLLRSADAGNPFEAGDPPLMILHGEMDQRAPLSDAELVFQLAKEAGVHVEFYTTPDFGHNLQGNDLLELKIGRDRTVLDRIDAFLQASFGREPEPVRSLRSRLFPRSTNGFDDGNQRPSPKYRPAGSDPLFRSELRSAVNALILSVREESDFAASLYGLSKPELLEHDFDEFARRDWSYWPRKRIGLPLRHMTAEQRSHTHRILSTLLSSKGYLQVNHIMMLEEILAGVESAGFARGAEEYMITVFGEPSGSTPWGLRFEGHHLSLNVTLTPDQVSVTPSFMGASPAPLATGIRAGFNPLTYEQRYALNLLNSLNESQRAAAVLAEEPLPEVLATQFQVDSTEWDAWQDRLARDGISASTFDASQKRLLRNLLTEIVGTYRKEVSRAWLDSVDLNTLAFAWMGEAEIGRPHYFRILGEHFVFELDAAQGNGTHVHTVWRDRVNDFGEDALREHYQKHEH